MRSFAKIKASRNFPNLLYSNYVTYLQLLYLLLSFQVPCPEDVNFFHAQLTGHEFCNLHKCQNANKTIFLLRPNKKIPMFRLTRPYLNLLVKPRIFSGLLVKPRIFFRYSGKIYIILCVLRGEMPFKMHKIIFLQIFFFFFKFVCLPYLKFSDLLP